MTTERTGSLSRAHNHAGCLLCGERNPYSLGLRFERGADDGVRAHVRTHVHWQGYPGILHGGVVAALLDAAMTHGLFQQGVRGVTADLHVRYVEPAPCGGELEVRARLVAARPPLYRLRAELDDGTRLVAWAEATFLPQRAGADA